MWSTALLMGMLAGFDPVRVGLVVFMLSRPRPLPLLVAFFIGGFGINLIVGAVVLFVLQDAGGATRGSAAGHIEIAIGLFALLVGAAVVSGLPAQLHRWVRTKRRADTEPRELRTGPPGLEQVPGFTKLPTAVQAALQNGSVWVAWVLGLCQGMPTAFYLAAIAAMLGSRAGVGSQIAALLLFNVLGFVMAEIPIVSLRAWPEATRARVDQFYGWITSHHRLGVGTVAGVVGSFFVILGVNNL